MRATARTRSSRSAAPPGREANATAPASGPATSASTFEALQAQIRSGLNIGLSGIPWWSTDIGGFHGGDPADPDYREVYRPLVPVGRLVPAVPPPRRPRAAHAVQREHLRRAERGLVVRRRGLRVVSKLLFLREALEAVHPRADALRVGDRRAADAPALVRRPGRRDGVDGRRPVRVRAATSSSLPIAEPACGRGRSTCRAARSGGTRSPARCSPAASGTRSTLRSNGFPSSSARDPSSSSASCSQAPDVGAD